MLSTITNSTTIIMTTIYANVTEIRTDWTNLTKKLAKTGKNGRILVLKNSKPLYEIRPFEENFDDENEKIEYLDEKTSKRVEEAMDEIKSAHKKGILKAYTANELIARLQTL